MGGGQRVGDGEAGEGVAISNGYGQGEEETR